MLLAKDEALCVVAVWEMVGLVLLAVLQLAGVAGCAAVLDRWCFACVAGR